MVILHYLGLDLLHIVADGFVSNDLFLLSFLGEKKTRTKILGRPRYNWYIFESGIKHHKNQIKHF